MMGNVFINDKLANGKDVFKEFRCKKEVLEKLGITNYTNKKFNKLSDIGKYSTGMVIGQSQYDCELNLNNQPIKFKSGEAYVMPLGHFQRAKYGKQKIFKPYRKSFDSCFRRYNGEDLTDKKLLIWRTGGLGDVCILQSVVKAIKDKYPTCKITFATSHAFHNIFQMWEPNLIDNIVGVPFVKDVLFENDYHMTFIHTIENCIETQSMPYLEIFKRVTTLDYNPQDYPLNLTPRLDYVNFYKDKIFPNTILLHMASSTKLRTYSLIHWKTLMEKLTQDMGYNLGIIDTNNKSDEIDGFIKNINLSKVFNFAKMSNDLLGSVAIASLCVGGIVIDSSFSHIMEGLKKPTVTICGPYTPYNVTGLYKYSSGISVNKCSCDKYPCHLNSQEFLCPYVSNNLAPACTTEINPDEIINMLMYKLDSSIK